MTWRWTPSHLTFAKALTECNGVGCRHILTDAKALAGAVILMNGCDWTMVLAMVQCSRLPEESISVPVVWLLGSGCSESARHIVLALTVLYLAKEVLYFIIQIAAFTVIQTTNLSVRIKRSSTFWCHQPGTEGTDAIAVAETFHALEECFCKCQEAQMQYKIRLAPAAFTSAPTHARSVRYYWGRQLWLMSHLWKRWVEEYLVTLTTREKWTKIRLKLENGDIVFLVEEGVTRGSWVRSWRRCRGVTITYSSGTSLSSEVKISCRNLGGILPTATCLVSGDHLVASWSRLEVFLCLSVPRL
ncbi:hypothetical protein T08_7827 [Trichinella sp. T8]|nr:hypothetical protein T08_7827 [Trichinella sp. T8]